MSESEVVGSTQPTTTVSSKNSRKLKTLWVPFVSGVVAVLIISVILSFAGIVYLGIKKPSQKATLQAYVCGKDEVAAYNSVMGFDSDDGAAKAEQTLSKLEESIRTRANNDVDPTCQYMLWQHAHSTGDKQLQKKYLHNLVTLNNKGAYASGEIKSLDNLETLKALTNEQKDVEERGQG